MALNMFVVSAMMKLCYWYMSWLKDRECTSIVCVPHLCLCFCVCGLSWATLGDFGAVNWRRFVQSGTEAAFPVGEKQIFGSVVKVR